MELILNYWKEIIMGSIVSGFFAIKKFLNKNKEIVSWIALRIEKDSQDGWTRGEKEQFGVDLYFNKFQPILSWYLRLISRAFRKMFIEKLIRSLIGKLCKKAKVLPKVKK